MRVRSVISWRLSVIVVAVTLAVGCAPAVSGSSEAASTPGGIAGGLVRLNTEDPTALEFKGVPVEQVWRVLPAAFAALRIPAGVLDEATRTFGNPKVRVTSVVRQPVRELFRCGAESGLSLSDYRIEFGIVVQPRVLLEGGTELGIQTTALGRLVSPNRTGTTHCVSNGMLEQKLHRQIQLELDRIGGR